MGGAVWTDSQVSGQSKKVMVPFAKRNNIEGSCFRRNVRRSDRNLLSLGCIRDIWSTT